MTRKITAAQANRDAAFGDIMEGLDDAVAIAEGRADPATYRVHVPATVNVKAIRKRERLTQDQFAAKYGFPAGTVKGWEQNRRQPEGAARILLTVIEREPEAVQRALAGS